MNKKKIVVLSITTLLLFSIVLASMTPMGVAGIVTKRHYITLTSDLRIVNLYRYTHLFGADKETPVVFIPGWSENHLLFDQSALIGDRSIAKYLAHDEWDVWVVDLRTHDTDGDPGTAAENEELMNKFWDFDRTYVQKDMVAAINFIKSKTGEDSLVLAGHSMGGNIAVAYAELIGQENLAGLITIGTPGKPQQLPEGFGPLFGLFATPDGHVRLLAPNNMDPNNNLVTKLMFADLATYDEGDATEWWLNWNYIGTLNDEPAGVCVDLWWGLDIEKHDHWLDPDGYNYTEHMADITVPFLGVAGDQDELAVLEATTAFFTENLLGSSDQTSLIFENYGHVDLLIGRNAPAEIYPEIRDWLNQRFS